jgi:prevent-host-death family protein
MKTITVTTARRHFGALLDTVQREPVLIRRKNRDASVIISAEEYRRIHGLKRQTRGRRKLTKKADGS